VSGLRARIGPGAIVFVLSPPISKGDIRALCDRVQRVLERYPADAVICDVGALVDPDAVTVDALARLQLTARRCGRGICLRNTCLQLQELLSLMGLREVLLAKSASSVEACGQAEEGEQALGVEKEADPGDPAP
jgi:ABC-type transporter Mla MlaB component